MRNATTAWYQAPTTSARPGRFGGRFGGGVAGAGDLQDPVAVAALLAHPQTRARLTREQWRDLWDLWGLDGLVSLSRGDDEEPDAEQDEAASRRLIDAALSAGFDPLSGLLGTYCARDRTFEISPVQ
jgi:hypothetical protein